MLPKLNSLSSQVNQRMCRVASSESMSGFFSLTLVHVVYEGYKIVVILYRDGVSEVKEIVLEKIESIKSIAKNAFVNDTQLAMEMGQDLHSQQMQKLIEVVSGIPNKIDGSNKSLKEILLNALESIPSSFNRFGEPDALILSGGQALQEKLPQVFLELENDPESRAKLEEINKKQYEEHLRRKSYRKLVD